MEPFLHTAGITAAAGLDTSEVKLGRDEKHPSPPQEEDNKSPLSLWS